MRSSRHESRFLLTQGYSLILGVGVAAVLVPVSPQSLGFRLVVLFGLIITTAMLARCLLRAAGLSVEPRLETRSFLRELPFALGAFALFLLLAALQAMA